jgi:hypothetical protein
MNESELTQHILEIKETQAANTTKLDMVVEFIPKLNERVTKTEKKISWIMGAGAAGTLFLGVLEWLWGKR